MITSIVVDEMTKIDFNVSNPNQNAVGHYYYGRIIGFSNDSLNGRLRVSIIEINRSQHVDARCCSPVNKLEEYLYF